MKRSLLLLALSVAFSVRAAAAPKMEIVPTFCSAGIYLPADKGLTCQLSFRPEKGGEWLDAYPPVYDTVRREFRGSIVRLDENTTYLVRAEFFSNSAKTGESTARFKTWRTDVPVIRTIPVSSLPRNNDGSIKISELRGSKKGWIRIAGDEEVSADRNGTYAILIERSEYLILEGLTVRGGGRHGIRLHETAENIRIVNCDIAGWGRIPADQNREGFYLDREGKMINNDAGIRAEKTLNTVVERCWVHDPAGYTNPWQDTVRMGAHKGLPFKGAHPQGPNAFHGTALRGGCVLRYNDFVGSQIHRYNDPVETAQNGLIDGGFGRDADIYGNMIAFGQDDAIELDGGQCNVRFFDNRMEQIYCGVSTAPNMRGPSYIFNNVLFNMGDSNDHSSRSVKNGGGFDFSFGRQFLFNNTMISKGGGMAAVGYGKREQSPLRGRFHATTRNNMFLSVAPTGRKNDYSVYDPNFVETNDFDFDMIGSRNAPQGKGTILAGEGAERNGVFAFPSFTGFDNAVFTLRPDDPGIGKGEFIPNFSGTERSARPNMGALSGDAPSLIPLRPLDMESDRYLIRLTPGEPRMVTIRVGMVNPTTYEVKMSEDMLPWLEVHPLAGEIEAGSIITLRLTSKDNVPYWKNGMIFVRLADGFSVPVTVTETRQKASQYIP